MQEIILELASKLIGWLSLLSVLIIGLRKWKPGLDPYLRTGTFILAEVDDVIDGILFEFSGKDSLNSINDLLDKVLSELEEAGYKVNSEDEKKVENRLKAKVKKEEGVKLEFDKGEYKIKYGGEF
ncbi:hypothetical protein BX659_12555 [Orenia metallireducens]|jgi:hypothetical protein|uniref:Uncharacterized protein n=1 Tax=Orenia metallireducens TaxID=1413210 RepID=A0A285HW63_9FIRM|nr:hypothetical protein [Orenia metallireducens]PRX24092.1 hypothetical protein BX659_12555 [Orenia metallireducens]SNY39036.1 hypothetical protein SAMN06265827_12456 [Orenia metallireducens]